MMEMTQRSRDVLSVITGSVSNARLRDRMKIKCQLALQQIFEQQWCLIKIEV